MNDSIVFLGTAGDPMVTGKQLRASGGFVIISEGNQFHVDPGPGALVRLKQAGINPRETISLFLSHGHLNHAGDADAVISAMTYNGMDKRGLLVAPESVVKPEEGTPAVRPFFRKCVEKYISFREDSKIGINEVEIQATPTWHHDTDALGFKFISPQHTISYTSDTEYRDALAEAHSNVDVLIINCKQPKGIREKGHLSVDDAAKLVEKARPKMAVITHFGIKALNSDPITMAREIQKQTDVQVLAAKDGMRVDPNTFASKVRQRKLKNFD